MNNAQAQARRQAAENRFYRALEGIPGRDDIWAIAVQDWILNVLPEDMNNFEVDDMREAVQGVFENGDLPQISGNQYIVLTDAFKQFVRDSFGVQGGKRKKTRKHKKRTKRTRKH